MTEAAPAPDPAPPPPAPPAAPEAGSSASAPVPLGTRPDRAMVLAAGRGRRLRPFTDRLPKPLVEIAGRTLLDRVLDRLGDAGVARAVVNAHHLADRLAAHLDARADGAAPVVDLVREPALLETGGSVAAALPRLGAAPFFVANADALWLDGPTPALARMAAAWDDPAMDALLLLIRAPEAVGMEGPAAESADFFLDPEGRVRRRPHGAVAPFFYGGVQLVHPRLFDAAPDPAAGGYSMVPLWDAAQAAGRLWGVVHDGAWFHVGTPAALEEVSRLFDPHVIRWVEP